nr:retrovirus-related Pol polyprotein from transposon TNT 1-94 [Tanacetum cinerariifolium]
MNLRGRNAVGYGGAQNRVGNVNQGQARLGQARTVKCYNCNGTWHIARNCTQLKRPQNSEYFKDKMLLMQAQENGVALDAEQLLFLAGGQDNAFDDDVDEQPVQDLALNVDDVFQADDCDAFDSDVDEASTAQTMFMANLSSADPITDEAGPSYDSDIMSEVQDHNQYMDNVFAHHEEHVIHDSYVKNDEVPVVHSNVSSVLNDAFMMIYNNMCEPPAQSVSNPSRSTVVKNSLTAELATYKEHVELPRPNPNEPNRVAIGYKNPLCLTHAKQVQPAVYNGHEIIKDNHKPTIVHNTEDTLKIAEITRKKMNDKMNGPECVTPKVKIAPHDYSKENFLATFTPQKQLTSKQIFWSNDLIKLKSKALKERTKVSRPIKAFTVKRDTIELKNLLIPNDNLISECLSQEVFCVATNYELNVAQFTEMHVANTTAEARCLALEAELANLRDTNNNDNQKELINHFSKLEGKDNVICQLKKKLSELQVTRSDTDYTPKAENVKIKQHYKELYDSIKITRAKHIEKVTKLTTENVNLKSSVSKDAVKPQVLVRAQHAIDVEPIFPRLMNNRDAHLDYLRHLKESVETIRDIVEEAKVVRPLDRSIVSACRYTKHSQELLEYAIDTCPHGSQQRAKQLAYILLIRKKQVTVAKPSDNCPNASGSHPQSHVKPHRISPTKGVNKLPVEDQPRTNKSHLRTSNRIDSSSRLKRTVVQIVLWYLVSGCSKHMKGDRSRLMNFVKKFIGTVRFGNDHFGAIIGYGDYVIGNSVISRTVPRTTQQNRVVERRNRTLIEAARTILIFSKAPMFLWAEAVATAFYTQNRSLIHTRHHMTQYEQVHNKKPDLTFFRVFGALCYPTNDNEDLGKLQPTTDTGIFFGYAPSRKGYRIYNKRTRRIMETIYVQFDELTEPMAPVHLSTGSASNFLTPGQISSSLVPNSVPATPSAPPPIKNWRFYFN